MLDVEVQPLLTPHIELVTLIDRGYFPAVTNTDAITDKLSREVTRSLSSVVRSWNDSKASSLLERVLCAQPHQLVKFWTFICSTCSLDEANCRPTLNDAWYNLLARLMRDVFLDRCLQLSCTREHQMHEILQGIAEFIPRQTTIIRKGKLRWCCITT